MPAPPRLNPRPAPPTLQPAPVEQSGIPTSVAVDRALQEATALNDMEKFLPSLEGNLQSSSFLLDVTKRLHSDITSETLQKAFVAEVNQAKTPEEVGGITSRYEQSISRQTADIRTLGYLNYLKTVPSDLYSQDAYNVYQREFLTPEDLQELREQTSQANLDEMRSIVNEFVAEKSFSGFREATEEVTKAALMPFQEGFINLIAGEAGVPNVEGSFDLAGFDRQETRDYLASLSEVDRKKMVESILSHLRAAEQHPVYGEILADFAVIDYAQSVLSDEVLQGAQGTDKLDLWMTNIIHVLDLTWVGGVLGRAARGSSRGLLSMFANRASRPTLRTADKVSTPVARDVTTTIRNDPAIRDTLNVPIEEVIASKLPVPEDILDDLVVIPDEVTELIPGLAARRAKVDALVSRNPRTWLASSKKMDIQSQELVALANASRGVLRPANSSIATIGQDEGFRIQALVGASEVSGWKGSPGLTDAISALQSYDPTKVKLSLMYRQPDGTIAPVPIENIGDIPQRAGVTSMIQHAEMEIARVTGLTPNSEFFIKVTKDRLWTPEENILFGDNPVLRSGIFTDVFDAPNYRMSPEVYNTTLQGTSVGQSVAAQLNEMLMPVWNLSDSDKRFVFSTYRWTNEFAQRTEKNPRLADYKAAFPEITNEQAAALYAMRYAQDTWFLQLNKRLYRNWHGQGYVTGVPLDDTLPTWHGSKIDITKVREGELYYDPVKREAKALTEEEIKSLYANNGGILEIDLPIGLPSSPRTMFTKIIVSKDSGYSIEALHTNVLPYHPGYFPNFNEDSFLIVKQYDSININGVERTIKESNKNSPEFSVAFRTADSLAGAEALVKKFINRRGRAPKGYTYAVVPVKDLTVQERAAQLNHLLNRQGRLFYDKRDYAVLRNLDGNLTELADPVQGMERVIGALSRQLGMEDNMRALKVKFRNQFPDLITENEWRVLDSKQIKDTLVAQRDTTLDSRKKKYIQNALSLWNHIRMLDGVDSDLFGPLRVWALDKAKVLNSKYVDKFIIDVAPLDVMRSAAFKAFMVTRPVRQRIMQGLQVLFLAGMDPTYILSGRVFIDGDALRIGIAKLKGLDTDWSNATLAKIMGITREEYNLLARKIADGGLLQHVNLHSFAGGIGGNKKLSLPKTIVGSTLQKPHKVGSYVMEKLQTHGFDLGERSNLVYTYMLALRKLMGNKRYKKYQELTEEDWDTVRNNASNLSFGMLRVNEFPYQRGLFKLGTQFLSFSHKALLALLGRNPAIKGKDVAKIWASGVLLFGADLFGAGDLVEGWIDQQPGGADLNPPLKIKIQRILANGFIDIALNAIGKATIDDWKSLDISSIAPGPGAIVNMYTSLVEAATAGGALPLFMGPVETITGNTVMGISTAVTVYHGDPDMTDAEKFMLYANELLRGGLPGYNDLNTAYDAYVLGEWYSKSGQSSEVRATWNTLLAKGLLALNSDEVNVYWRLRNNDQARRDAIQNRVTVDKTRIRRVVNLYLEGTDTKEGLINVAIMIGNLTQTLPEEDKPLYYQGMQNAEWGGFNLNAWIGELVASGRFDRGMLANVNQLEGVSKEDKEALAIFVANYEAELAGVNTYIQERTETFEAEQKQDAPE